MKKGNILINIYHLVIEIMDNVTFLIGTPRCGKSTTLELLASSGQFAWLSSHQKFLPGCPEISILNRLYDIPDIGLKLYHLSSKQKRYLSDYIFLPHPVESKEFWKKYLSKFENLMGNKSIPPKERPPPSLKNAVDLSELEVKRIRKAVKRICERQKKDHFLTEYSKWPRMDYLSRAFPLAKFVHIIRDGRAVSYEYYRKMIESNYIEWEEREWWIRGWPNKWKKEFLEKYNSRLAFCAYQWKFLLDLIWEDADRISNDRYLEVRYEELVKEPKNVLSDILNFSEGEFTERLNQYLNQKELVSMNSRWIDELTKTEKKQLNEIIHEKRYSELFDKDAV